MAVLTSGGDAPGMNAAIRAVVRTALHHEIEVYGIQSGFAGLVKHHAIPLNSRSVANCIQRGGTILKTDRYKEFHHGLAFRAAAMKNFTMGGLDTPIQLDNFAIHETVNSFEIDVNGAKVSYKHIDAQQLKLNEVAS